MNVDSEKIKNIFSYPRNPSHHSRSTYRQLLNDLRLYFDAFRYAWKNKFMGSRKKNLIGLLVFVGLSVSGVKYSLAATLFQIPYTADYQTRNFALTGPGNDRRVAENNWYFNTGNGAVKAFLSTNILSKVGSPPGDLCLDIYAHGSATTSDPGGGTHIAQSCIASSSVTGTANIGFTFTSPWLPSGTTTYSLVYSMAGGAVDTSNYYTIKTARNGPPYNYFQYSSSSYCGETGGAWGSPCTALGNTDLITGVFYSGSPVSDTLATSAQAFANAWNSYTSSTWNCTNSTSTSGQGFTDALACAAKSTAYEVLSFMFVPHPFVTNIFTNAFQILADGFPFNLFFESVDEIQSQINTGSFETDGTLGFKVMVPGGNSSSSVTISSTTFNNTLGSSFMAGVFQLQKFLAWAFFIWFAYKLVFK